MKRYSMVQFKDVEGHIVPCQPWPQVFAVTDRLVEYMGWELRPATVTGIAKAIAMNFVSMNWWRLCRLAWRAGFLDTQEGYCFSWRDLRWNSRRTRRGRV